MDYTQQSMEKQEVFLSVVKPLLLQESLKGSIIDIVSRAQPPARINAAVT